jgi:2-polyprenyl-3-methyl-5-hydroxy-6-metoxy-1,4-benzoquinol methylase
MKKRKENMADKNNVYKDYEKIADWFDQHRAREFFEKPYLDTVISHFKPNAKILDLGCGMGEPIAQYLIAQEYDVVGVDGSAKLIHLAQQRYPQARWIVQDMREIRLNQKFNAIIMWHSLFHLSVEDQKKMFLIIADHLHHDGILLFTSGDQAGEVWSNNGGVDLYHASLSVAEYSAVLEQNNFEVLLHNVQDPNCGDATVWMARLR